MLNGIQNGLQGMPPLQAEPTHALDGFIHVYIWAYSALAQCMRWVSAVKAL